jgi:SNF2 family DNA or RNA helicase
MSKVQVSRNGSKIVVVSPPSYRDVLATIPTREWDPRRMVWNFAATPFVAASLVRRLRSEATSRDDLVEVSDTVRSLAAQPHDVRAAIARFSAEVPPGATIPAVAGSRFSPWRHQYVGAGMIATLPASFLAWEMGTGKTKGVIDGILLLHEKGPRVVLIVCPASVVDVWAREVPKHVEDPDSRFVVAASTARQVVKRVREAKDAIERAEATGRTAIVVTNYESFTLDSSPFLIFATSRTWDLLVLDESHRIASPGTKTSRAMTSRVGPLAARRVCLSGTPMRNSPLDLYSQCRFLDAGIFGSNQRQFLERYATLDFFGNVVGLQNTEELAERFGLVAMRVDKRAVLDLPPVTVQTRRCSLGDEGRKIYQSVEDELATEIGDAKVVAANSLVRLLRLQQITSGYVAVETESGATVDREVDGAKIAELAEILDEIRPDEPVVVFCRFRRDLRAVQSLAKDRGRGYRELSGDRNELRDWQDARGGEVLGVQIKAGGVGVDGTRAAYVVFFSVGFSLADYEQALARVDRPGQTRPVTAINLVVRGTVDEAVFGAIESKKDVVEGVLDYLRGRRGASSGGSGAVPVNSKENVG